jgi:hypothetical protein
MQYKDVKTLLNCELVTDEDPKTAQLIQDLRIVRKRGYLEKDELLLICKWKSARALPGIRKNSADEIRRISAAAFATRSERRRLELLDSLHGVGIPMASAILTLTDPRRYGVIDIRVWQLLFDLKSVHTKAKGVNFTFKNWYHYLMKLRYHAKMIGVSSRTVEWTLFRYHQKIQRGRLYS